MNKAMAKLLASLVIIGCVGCDSSHWYSSVPVENTTTGVAFCDLFELCISKAYKDRSHDWTVPMHPLETQWAHIANHNMFVLQYRCEASK